jgi:hypothetical protein
MAMTPEERAQERLNALQQTFNALKTEATGLAAGSLEQRDRELQAQAKELELAQATLEAQRNGYSVASSLAGINAETVAQKEKELQLAQRIRSTYTETASALKDMAGLNNSLQKRFVQSLMESRNAGGGLRNALETVGKEIQGNTSKQEVFANAIVNSGSRALRFGDILIGATKELVLAQDQAFAAFARMTGQTGAVRQEMVGLERSMYQFGVTTEMATKTQGALFSVVTQFTQMTSRQRTELSQTTAILERFGVGAETTAQSLQVMTAQLGMSAGSAADLSTQIFTFAQRAGIATSQVAADFARLGPQLAVFGDQAASTFMRLEMAAKQTGMSIDSMMAQSAKFDRFNTAADAVGRLNAILGGPYLSTVQMVMATDPTTRMQMMADAVRQAGRSFDELAYYERLALKEAMGLQSVGELAMVMRGQFETLNSSVMMTGDQFADLARQEREFNAVTDEYRQVLRSLAAELLPLVRSLGNFLSFLGQHVGTLQALIPLMVSFKITMAALPIVLQAVAAGFITMNAAAGGLGIALLAMTAGVGGLMAAFTASGSPKFYDMGFHIAGGFNAMASSAGAAAQGVGMLGASVDGVSRAMKDVPDLKVANFKSVMSETRRVTEEVASAGAGGASLAIGVARAAAQGAAGGYAAGAQGQDIVLNVNLDGEKIRRAAFRGMNPV